MNLQVLIDSIVRQTTVLMAQLATWQHAVGRLQHLLDNAMIGNHATFDGAFTNVSIGDYSQLK
jgi:predicted glycoside hydrolase/deacetylase ChbG (UPF0249 family)